MSRSLHGNQTIKTNAKHYHNLQVFLLYSQFPYSSSPSCWVSEPHFDVQLSLTFWACARSTWHLKVAQNCQKACLVSHTNKGNWYSNLLTSGVYLKNFPQQLYPLNVVRLKVGMFMWAVIFKSQLQAQLQQPWKKENTFSDAAPNPWPWPDGSEE